GAYSCASTINAQLKMHMDELAIWDIDVEKGFLLRTQAIWDNILPFNAPYWYGGGGYWRGDYPAGFAPIPEDGQECRAHVVAARFWMSKRGPGLISESIPGVVSRVLAARGVAAGMPGEVASLLAPYRGRKILTFGG